MFYLISTLICILVNLLLGYIYRNSETSWGAPCKPTVATWLVFGILTFVPIANIVLTIALAVFLAMCYGDGDYIISDKHWLGRRL
jgi:predicted membrane protein